jgi:hypothetical protein
VCLVDLLRVIELRKHHSAFYEFIYA